MTLHTNFRVHGKVARHDQHEWSWVSPRPYEFLLQFPPLDALLILGIIHGGILLTLALQSQIWENDTQPLGYRNHKYIVKFQGPQREVELSRPSTVVNGFPQSPSPKMGQSPERNVFNALLYLVFMSAGFDTFPDDQGILY